MPGLQEIALNDYMSFTAMANDVRFLTGYEIRGDTIRGLAERQRTRPTWKTLVHIAATVQHRGYNIQDVPELWDEIRRKYEPNELTDEMLVRLRARLTALVKE